MVVEVSWCDHLQLYHECLLEGARGWGNDRWIVLDREDLLHLTCSELKICWYCGSKFIDPLQATTWMKFAGHSPKLCIKSTTQRPEISGSPWFTHQLRHPVAKFAPSPAVYRVLSIDQSADTKNLINMAMEDSDSVPGEPMAGHAVADRTGNVWRSQEVDQAGHRVGLLGGVMHFVDGLQFRII